MIINNDYRFNPNLTSIEINHDGLCFKVVDICCSGHDDTLHLVSFSLEGQYSMAYLEKGRLSAKSMEVLHCYSRIVRPLPC